MKPLVLELRRDTWRRAAHRRLRLSCGVRVVQILHDGLSANNAPYWNWGRLEREREREGVRYIPSLYAKVYPLFSVQC